MRSRANGSRVRRQNDKNGRAFNHRNAETFLKLISGKNRLRILQSHHVNEMSVGELAHLLGFRQPRVSQELARLRAAHIVEIRQSGKKVYYSIRRNEMRSLFGAVMREFGNI